MMSSLCSPIGICVKTVNANTDIKQSVSMVKSHCSPPFPNNNTAVTWMWKKIWGLYYLIFTYYLTLFNNNIQLPVVWGTVSQNLWSDCPSNQIFWYFNPLLPYHYIFRPVTLCFQESLKFKVCICWVVHLAWLCVFIFGMLSEGSWCHKLRLFELLRRPT